MHRLEGREVAGQGVLVVKVDHLQCKSSGRHSQKVAIRKKYMSAVVTATMATMDPRLIKP
jgi:hypothetical protein